MATTWTIVQQCKHMQQHATIEISDGIRIFKFIILYF